jgi:hypothetical protein
MLHLFHANAASVCPKCFICFKCMLHSSVSCCKCRPTTLVSMRVCRAMPRPPTRGGGTDRCRRFREEAQVAQCCCGRDRAVVKEAGESLPGSLEEMDAVPVWKRQGRVIRAAWAADLKRAVRMRTPETELARAVHKSERTGRSHGRPDGRKRPDVWTLMLRILKNIVVKALPWSRLLSYP